MYIHSTAHARPQLVIIMHKKRNCFGEGLSCKIATWAGFEPTVSCKMVQLVLSAADNKYIQKYLNGSVYISVMVRMEMILKRAKQTNTRSKKHFMEQCLNYILQKCEQIKKETGITRVFLAHDIGNADCSCNTEDFNFGNISKKNCSLKSCSIIITVLYIAHLSIEFTKAFHNT